MTTASPARATGIAASASMFGLLPVWLASGLSVLMADVRLDEGRLGVAVSTFFAASAVAAWPGGRLADRWGPRRSIGFGLLVTVACVATIAGATRDWWHLLVPLAIAGGASTVLQPAANLLLATEVPPHRQGLAIGFKQAAIPLSTLLAGLAVPLVGATLGWRAAYWTAAVFGLALATGIRTRDDSGRVESDSGTRRLGGSRSDLALLMLAASSTVAAVTAGSTFLVQYAFQSGMSVERAGLTLSAASVAGVIARVTTGWFADRVRSSGMTGMAALMGIGATGAVALAAGAGGTLLVLAAMLMLGAGWGWNALMVLAVIRRYPEDAGQASGLTLVALRIGSAVGPGGFGILVSSAGYQLAWSAVALLMATGAAISFSLRGRWQATN